VQCVGDPLFRRWAELVGEPDWPADPRFASDIARGENGGVLSARMAEWCGKRSSAEALAELERARIPAGPIYSPRETLADPHVRGSGLLVPVAFPGLGEPAPVLRTPVALSESPGEIRVRAPVLGEHTDAILGELGYAPREIAALRAAGAV
jgi:crotonobetainyl-CoA:carnitine CoA-transferase CaiB-like acyl-CoA transferase